MAAIVLDAVCKRFDHSVALEGISATIDAGRLTGLVGPDGSGKTTLLRLLAALLTPTSGEVRVHDLDVVHDRDRIHALIGYMPQRFGLYEELSVLQNLRLYADLKSLPDETREETFDRLLTFTRLGDFVSHAAGSLSGGMKQKLGLACALIGEPRILLLDEPSVGVDPISRRELWSMVGELTGGGMTVLWSTAYLDEAERCDDVLLLNQGGLAFDGPPREMTDRLANRSYSIVGFGAARRRMLSRLLDAPEICDATIQGSSVRLVLADEPDARAHVEEFAADAGGELVSRAPRFEDAYIDFLGGSPPGTSPIAERMEEVSADREIMVRCRNLTKQFGTFTAAGDITFDVRRGEVFGLLGPNGAGKSTTFRMLCGLLKPTSGSAEVAGADLRRAPGDAKRQLGYMAQKFSLYGLLSVEQNLEFFSAAYGLRGKLRRQRVEEVIEIFGLERFLDASPDTLPLGYKQRLAMGCALLHRPRVLFLDEPTSGVDPVTRREFWTHITGAVNKGVTVLVTTHFLEEAEYCDRIALIHRSRLIALDSTDALKASVATSELPEPTMEDAFVKLVEADERHREEGAA